MENVELRNLVDEVKAAAEKYGMEYTNFPLNIQWFLELANKAYLKGMEDGNKNEFLDERLREDECRRLHGCS